MDERQTQMQITNRSRSQTQESECLVPLESAAPHEGLFDRGFLCEGALQLSWRVKETLPLPLSK